MGSACARVRTRDFPSGPTPYSAGVIELPPAHADAVLEGVRGTGLWRQVRTVVETGSTNADLAALARREEPEGLVLVAEHQVTGKGRFSRVWSAPAGTSLAISLLVRPTRPLRDWGWLSLLTGMAVEEGIREATGVEKDRLELKWPNDVLIDARKVCGILSERVPTASGDAAVVGMGLNIAIEEADLPVPTATSLRLAGLSEDKDAVLIAILVRWAELYRLWQERGELRREYRDACTSIGRSLRVEHATAAGAEGEDFLGTGVDIDAEGRLVVLTPGGTARAFAAGDVHHLR